MEPLYPEVQDPNQLNEKPSPQNQQPGPQYTPIQVNAAMPVESPPPVIQNAPIAQNPPMYQNQPTAQGQPFVNTPIVVNQTGPMAVTPIVVPPNFFKLSSVVVQCPYCHQPVNTVVQTSFNCGTCCFAYLALWIYVIVQLVRGKDLLCCDAQHVCPLCGAVIGSYNAC